MEMQCLVWHKAHLFYNTGTKQTNVSDDYYSSTLEYGLDIPLKTWICVSSVVAAICLHSCRHAASNHKNTRAGTTINFFFSFFSSLSVNSFSVSAEHSAPNSLSTLPNIVSCYQLQAQMETSYGAPDLFHSRVLCLQQMFPRNKNLSERSLISLRCISMLMHVVHLQYLDENLHTSLPWRNRLNQAWAAMNANAYSTGNPLKVSHYFEEHRPYW